MLISARALAAGLTDCQHSVCTKDIWLQVYPVAALSDKCPDVDENLCFPLSQRSTECKRLLREMLSSEYPVPLPSLSSLVSLESCSSSLIRDIHRRPGPGALAARLPKHPLRTFMAEKQDVEAFWGPSEKLTTAFQMLTADLMSS